jgi:hypothetical protein
MAIYRGPDRSLANTRHLLGGAGRADHLASGIGFDMSWAVHREDRHAGLRDGTREQRIREPRGLPEQPNAADRCSLEQPN